MTQHPDLAAGAGVRRSRLRVPRSGPARTPGSSATSPRPGSGGTFQARYERDVFDEALVTRLTQLDLGQCRARLRPHRPGPVEDSTAGESFHIGRLAVADEDARAGRRRLAGAGRRALLPGDRPRPDGPGPPAPLRHQGPAAARPSRTSCSARATSGVDEGRTGGLSRLLAPCSPRSRPAAPASSATSSARSRPSRTRSSAPRSPASWSCRAARAPARRWWRCTAPPTCSTRTGSRSRTRACWSSAPTGCSSATSSRCCPSLGEAGVELVVLADLVPDVRPRRLGRPPGGPGQGRRPHGEACWPRPCTTASARCGRTWSCRYGVTTLRLDRRATATAS